MEHCKYIETRNSLIKSFSDKIKINEDENLNGQYNLVSAGLLNYLPLIEFDDHYSIFKQILLHKKLSSLEQSSYNVLDYLETENLTDDILQLIKTKPTILCTFHTGSYRAINLFLTKQKIPYTLVMGKNVMQKEASILADYYANLPERGTEESFKLIDAEAANSGLQMIRELKKGRSLLLYIDGNSGAGASSIANNNCRAVNFLGQKVLARTGIGFLAHTANIPIVTVVCYRLSWENIRLKFFDPIYPDLMKDRSVFANEATQKIYNMAAPIIENYPEQWEAWLYIHKVASIVNSNKPYEPVKPFEGYSEQLIFHEKLFGLIQINDNTYLFQKNTYLFYQIENSLYQILKGNTVWRPDSLNTAQLRELYEQGVVTYC